MDKSEEYFELLGHYGPILAIDTSPKELLASASGDGTIKIWDLKEKQEIRTITGFEKVKSFYAAKSFGKFSQNIILNKNNKIKLLFSYTEIRTNKRKSASIRAG